MRKAPRASIRGKEAEQATRNAVDVSRSACSNRDSRRKVGFSGLFDARYAAPTPVLT
jgi:hypothetical protein